MGENSIVAYQGRNFNVTLQSMLGSTNYGWCLANLPEGIVLSGTENVHMTQRIGPVNQIFYFGVTEVPENPDVVLKFKLLNLSNYSDSSDEVDINVQIVPYNKNCMEADAFVQYSENSAVYNAQMPYGFVLNDQREKYGYPCIGDVTEKYGYPCVGDVTEKYGYPCVGDNTMLKYGYPCGDNTMLKYGYPCGGDNTMLKYGYPCGDNTILKYGYPCGENTMLKYGYPCGENAMLKYGYPCEDKTVLKYGYPNCQ